MATVINDYHQLEPDHFNEHPQQRFEYTRYGVLPRAQGKHCIASVIEIPPGKSAYPNHYHTQVEEVFYILSGEGKLMAADGEHPLAPGCFLVFAADESGAHRLMNTSATQPLCYIDFANKSPSDVCIYPDSGKVGVWGKAYCAVFRQADEVDYYDGE